MKNIPKKILKIFAGIIVSLIIVILSLYFFIQTESFNRWALQFTLDRLNEDSQSRGININVDSIQGNILERLILKKGSLKIREDTLFSFSFVDLNYNLRGLLENEIRLNNIIINSPVINISKIKESDDSTVWKISKLFISSREPADKSQSVFVIENLKIENGSLTVKGQLSSEMPEWRRQNQKMKEFDLNNLEVKNLGLELSVRNFPSYKNIAIRNLSFNSNSDFNVRKLTTTFGFNIIDSITEFQNFELITDRSNFLNCEDKALYHNGRLDRAFHLCRQFQKINLPIPD